MLPDFNKAKAGLCTRREILIDIRVYMFFERNKSFWKMMIIIISHFPNLSTEEQDNYFLLCDVLPEDRVLREELQKQRLVRIAVEDEQCVGNTCKITFVILFVCFHFLICKLSYTKETIHKNLKTEEKYTLD